MNAFDDVLIYKEDTLFMVTIFEKRIIQIFLKSNNLSLFYSKINVDKTKWK